MSIIVIAFNGVIYFALWWKRESPYPLTRWLHNPACWWITSIAVVVMIDGSARKRWQLCDAGVALAHLLGATEVPPDTAITDEHQLINIVEEMSIASGIPAPRVFVMRQDQAINAFVAGFRPTETLPVTTQGLLDQLDRDEIQGGSRTNSATSSTRTWC